MRFSLPTIALAAILAATPAAGEGPDDIVTAPDAILCLSRDNVATANEPAVVRRTFAMNVSQIYDAETEPVEMKIKLEAAN